LLFKKGALQRELVDVNEIVREMIVILRSEASRYSISIRGVITSRGNLDLISHTIPPNGKPYGSAEAVKHLY